jgi:hypothetical protein
MKWFQLGALLTLFFFYACNPLVTNNLPDGVESVEEIEIRVGWYLVPVKVDEMWLSMVYQQGEAIGTDHWKPIYDIISGFDFKPGEISDILVSKQKLVKPKSEEMAYRYKLLKIIKKEKVATDKAFNLFMHKDFINFDGENYSIMNNIPFDCGIACDILSRKLQNGASISCRWSDDLSTYVYLD